MANELVTPTTIGRDAYRAGLPISANPYDWKYGQQAWADGWTGEMIASAGTTRHRFALGVYRRETDARRIFFVWAESMVEAMKLGSERILASEKILTGRYVESRDEVPVYSTAQEVARRA